MLAGGEGGRTAVMRVSRPSGAPVDVDTVARFRLKCEGAGVGRAMVITDSAFTDECRLETGGGVEMELWNWDRLRWELQTHLLGVR